MKKQYQTHGFLVKPAFFSSAELKPLESVVWKFHQRWLQDNHDFYHSHALNSAYLTSTQYLNPRERLVLFQFIGSLKIQRLLTELFSEAPSLMNTQLFFNPVNQTQKNYWHRDIQYAGLPEEAQKKALTQINVIHFRVPLKSEHGLEVVPGTHRRWDTPEEYAVRTKAHGKHVYDDLPNSQAVPLNQGDLLIFSANMIHRGLYGLDRFAFDILFCDSTPNLLQYSKPDCYPTAPEMDTIANPSVFLNALNHMPS